MSEVLNFLNRKFNINLSEVDLNFIKDFVLLWNLLESKYQERNFRINNVLREIENNANRFNCNNEKLNDIFSYFYDRYQDRERLEKLNLKNNNFNFVKEILNKQKEEITCIEKIKLIMLIVYRYRNNLFHGEKDLTYIEYQKENFNYANKFLIFF